MQTYTHKLDDLRLETTIRIEGVVRARPVIKGTRRWRLGLSKSSCPRWRYWGPSKILPFQIVDGTGASEATRLQYRFLDLRRNELHKNMVLRSRVISFIRESMIKLGFLEMQTPILTVSSPEGRETI